MRGKGTAIGGEENETVKRKKRRDNTKERKRRNEQDERNKTQDRRMCYTGSTGPLILLLKCWNPRTRIYLSGHGRAAVTPLGAVIRTGIHEISLSSSPHTPPKGSSTSNEKIRCRENDEKGRRENKNKKGRRRENKNKKGRRRENKNKKGRRENKNKKGRRRENKNKKGRRENKNKKGRRENKNKKGRRRENKKIGRASCRERV